MKVFFESAILVFTLIITKLFIFSISVYMPIVLLLYCFSLIHNLAIVFIPTIVLGALTVLMIFFIRFIDLINNYRKGE